MTTHKGSKNLRRTALGVALSMCIAGAAWAADTGGLRITITGAGGTPVAGATVKVSSPSSLISKTGTTDANGVLRLVGLDPATNYTVEVVASGYNDFSAGNVAVVSGKDLNLGYVLGGGGDATNLDAIVVTGASLAAIDTTSATVSSVLTLDQVEALPTGRNYQSYLQLVPGVKPSSGGNPSSKSGVNYSDIGGSVGSSTDNVYLLDGVDVTDPSTGTFGANFNSEIIQEQQVITGGVPAEYAGGSGLISKVVTKSGSDEWHGSLNYYFQNDSLVEKNKHNTDSGFSTYDTAFTLGGPIVKEKLWFFASHQKKYRETDVVNAQTGEAMRTVDSDAEYSFFKATWQITDDDRLTATWFRDPTDISGTTNASTLNNRDFAQKQGGDNYKLEYSHDWENFRLNAYGFRHEGELSQLPADLSDRNTIAFRASAGATLEQRNLGGLGSAYISERNRDEFGASAEWWLDTDFGSHTFKLGVSSTENEYFENTVYTGNKAIYTSIDNQYSGLTLDEAVAGLSGGNAWTTRPIVGADYSRILSAISESPNSAYFVGLLDTNGDGAVSPAELGAYQLTSTAGNPGGYLNNYRIIETQAAPYTVSSKGKTFYLQDTWTLNQLTVNAGVRAEEWTHYDSKGGQSAKFKWELAPRLSLVYDLFGDGRTKVWGYYGRYYDPIRNNMSDFAGNLTGPSYDEQIFLGDQWLTFRVRGGEKDPDALFAPSTKTPYTDEFLVGFSNTFRDDLSLSFTITKRVTKDVLEDYDLALYSDPNGDYDGDGVGPDFGTADENSKYYLPLSYFGYTTVPNSNYVIATLAGGKREYMGYEISLQKFKKDHWQGALSYTYNDAHGNTNSDSNADFQGDWIAIDPRAPNMWGPQAGNIKHQFKAWGSYAWDNGFEVSGVFNWNSGVLYTTAQLVSSRYLPVMGDPYVDGGVEDTWVLPGSVGANEGPSYYTFDVRAKYTQELPVGKLEFFLDVFNILNKQSPTAESGLVSGGTYGFGESSAWVEPRRLYLGARYTF
ncbi:hypothetical protein GCM10027084_24910 [Pseudoxanthomonas sangjuensis]|uniref:TonB-dependent receptor n=1 Tax=Pseudoxanthomonas sangjuensis TaxID=1503750 RepID=UPI001390E0FD|nr:TonB-dependent receptor [Pseudoxanthomonas sangjuensis]KAF1711054.1 TonB-dependent receptor [Pseudoxanthomonas sangjuensis]